jgi:hypothetical protein
MNSVYNMERCKYCQAKKASRWKQEPGFHHHIFNKPVQKQARMFRETLGLKQRLLVKCGMETVENSACERLIENVEMQGFRNPEE